MTTTINIQETGTVTVRIKQVGVQGIPGTPGSFPVSAGLATEPIIVDNLDGSITVPESLCNLYVDDVFTPVPTQYTIPEETFILTDNETNYVVVDYSGGSPVYDVLLDVSIIEVSSIVPVNTIGRKGTDLHFLSWDTPGVGLAEKLFFKGVKISRFDHESGLAISEFGTRNVKITAGLVWNGVKRNVLEEFNSDVNKFTQRFHTSGVWDTTLVTQYNNTHYDDGTDLVEAGANKYLVNWIYRDVSTGDNHSDVVLGSAQYNTLALALASPLPSALQEIMYTHHILVGRIIVQKDSDTAAAIETAFGASFSGAIASIHNELSGLDGGTAGEYYHLTSDEHTAVDGTEKTDHDATGGGTMTINVASGRDQKIAADDTAFTIAKGTWDETRADGVTLVVRASAGVGTISWTGWSFVNNANAPDGSGITTYGVYRIKLIAGEYYIFVIEEG